MIAIAKTHTGWVRKANEDALLCLPQLYAVADGMGGHKAGEVASQSTLEIVKDAVADQKPDAAILEQAIQVANQVLFQRQLENKSLEGMGTTLTILWPSVDEMLIGHVGDSRAYLFRAGKMRQVTKDHSLVADMVEKGLITKEKAKVHPYRNVITRAVGTAADIVVDTYKEERKPGDLWLICSDGLYGMADEKAILKAFQEENLETAAQSLMNLALENGGRDNITLILLKDEEAGQ